MRKITVPNHVNVRLGPDGQESVVRFVDFLDQAILSDPKMGATLRDIRTANKMFEKFEHAEPGSDVTVDEEPWKKLCQVLEAPTNGYMPKLARQIETFFTAIEGAKEV